VLYLGRSSSLGLVALSPLTARMVGYWGSEVWRASPCRTAE